MYLYEINTDLELEILHFLQLSEASLHIFLSNPNLFHLQFLFAKDLSIFKF